MMNTELEARNPTAYAFLRLQLAMWLPKQCTVCGHDFTVDSAILRNARFDGEEADGTPKLVCDFCYKLRMAGGNQ